MKLRKNGRYTDGMDVYRLAHFVDIDVIELVNERTGKSRDVDAFGVHRWLRELQPYPGGDQ